jgi:TrmH family RNA methyltransferase
MKPESITSAKNPLLKSVRRAIVRGTLTDEGLAVAESFHLLEESLRSDCAVETVIASESILTAVTAHVRVLNGTRVFTVPDALFSQLSSTDSPQGVLALVRPPAWTVEQALRGQSLVIVLDGVQEPGNAGAILRAAEAFGASGALFLKGTVSPFNPKAMRASAGSIFRLPCVCGLEESVVAAALEQKRITLFAALPAGGPEASSLDLAQKCAFVIGSEGRGVSAGITRRARPIRIPTTGVESLNAAVAAGILLYEARRQRMQAS